MLTQLLAHIGMVVATTLATFGVSSILFLCLHGVGWHEGLTSFPLWFMLPHYHLGCP